jgi:hypothetical protein
MEMLIQKEHCVSRSMQWLHTPLSVDLTRAITSNLFQGERSTPEGVALSLSSGIYLLAYLSLTKNGLL